MMEFQWFLMELSVRPRRYLVNCAHWLPKFLCRMNSIHYSFSVHSVLLMSGLRWLCHLYLHCFPTRPTSKDSYLANFKQWVSISARRVWQRAWPKTHPLPKSMLFCALLWEKSTFWLLFLKRIVELILDASRTGFIDLSFFRLLVH